MFLAVLLLSSGIANAYCSIDEAAGLPRDYVVNAQQVHDQGTTDECPGFPDLVKEDAKHHPQFDAALALHDATPSFAVPATRPVRGIDQRELLAESVFRRFPRLLN